MDSRTSLRNVYMSASSELTESLTEYEQISTAVIADEVAANW